MADANTNIFDETSQTLRPDATVAGQLDTVLKSDSPLMQTARTQTAQAANSRGLLNTSIAAGAGEQAVINSALPIAQADAATVAGFGKQILTGNQAIDLQNIENQNKLLLQSSQNASDLFKTSQAAISDILNDTKLDAGAKTAAIEKQSELLRAGLGVIGGINNLDLTGLLNFNQYTNGTTAEGTATTSYNYNPTPAPAQQNIYGANFNGQDVNPGGGGA